MKQITNWRGYDLAPRMAKIRKCFELAEVTSEDDVPIVVFPTYFPFGSEGVPLDYYNNPASMVKYQEDCYAKHLARVNDDAIPYFMPWMGTTVLASAFGCKIKEPQNSREEFGVLDTPVKSVADIAKLKMPDPYKDGLMPRVLEFIDHAVKNSDLPVGLTDMNSPLSTACQLCGYDKIFLWMYDEPKLIHDLMSIVTDAFIDWTTLQKKHIGEPITSSNGLQGTWSPKGGVWVSDDDLTLLNAELYEEFVVPHYSKIFDIFGGSVHFCGNGYHQIKNILKIKGLTTVNNSPIGNFKGFSEAVRQLSGKAVIQIQDIAPVDMEGYYPRVFEGIDDFRGIMMATFALDSVSMDINGGSVSVDRDVYDVANKVADSVRKCVRRKLKK
jgi:uroporphyrinogen-III decarboxylase